MTDAQMEDCIQAGIGHKPTADDLVRHLHADSGKKLTHAEQLSLLDRVLRGSPDEYRIKVLKLILRIPSGHLISYGELAKWANREFGLNITPRNTAWLRKKIYGVIGHDTDIPIHRIANAGDTTSRLDHPVTQEINRRKRGAEGSLQNPNWITM